VQQRGDEQHGVLAHREVGGISDARSHVKPYEGDLWKDPFISGGFTHIRCSTVDPAGRDRPARRECLDRMLITGERHLRLIREYDQVA
jgi:hypothetical protein